MAIYDAYVTVRYKVPRICADEDVGLDDDATPEAVARAVIDSEGISGLVNDAGEILSIQLIAVEQGS
jgi:hypothetical protein